MSVRNRLMKMIPTCLLLGLLMLGFPRVVNAADEEKHDKDSDKD